MANDFDFNLVPFVIKLPVKIKFDIWYFWFYILLLFAI